MWLVHCIMTISLEVKLVFYIILFLNISKDHFTANVLNKLIKTSQYFLLKQLID